MSKLHLVNIARNQLRRIIFFSYTLSAVELCIKTCAKSHRMRVEAYGEHVISQTDAKYGLYDSKAVISISPTKIVENRQISSKMWTCRHYWMNAMPRPKNTECPTNNFRLFKKDGEDSEEDI